MSTRQLYFIRIDGIEAGPLPRDPRARQQRLAALRQQHPQLDVYTVDVPNAALWTAAKIRQTIVAVALGGGEPHDFSVPDELWLTAAERARGNADHAAFTAMWHAHQRDSRRTFIPVAAATVVFTGAYGRTPDRLEVTRLARLLPVFAALDWDIITAMPDPNDIMSVGAHYATHPA